MAAGDVYADILTGRWTQAEFDANPDVILGNGQRIDLADDSGMFKLGDGARLLGVLPWLGGSSGTITLSNTKILVGNASNEAAEVSLTLSATPGAFALENTGELTMPNASPITRGLLSNSDWVTFNDKVPSSRSVSTSSPLSGGGILSGNLTLSISQSGASNDGFLSSFDWNTFNSKEPSLAAGTTAQYYRGDKSWQTLNTEVESVVNPLLTLKADLASPTFTGVTTFQNIIRLTSATPGTAVAGNIEFLTDKFYGVITTGTSRKEFVLADTALTSGRLLFTTTNGRAVDSSLITYNGATVTIDSNSTSSALYVVGANSGTSLTNGVGMTITNSNNTTGNVASMAFTSTVGAAYSAYFGAKFVDRTNNYGDFFISTRSAGGLSAKLYVKSTGEVSIGETSLTPTVIRDLTVIRNSNAPIGLRIENQSTGTAATSQFSATAGSSVLGFSVFSQNYSGNFASTSIPIMSASLLQSGSTYNNALVLGGTPIYLLAGQTGTNVGLVSGTTGIRIDTNNALHNALSSGVSFHINTGKLRYSSRQIGNTGLSSGDIYVDSAANILANGDYVVGMKA